MALQRTRYRVDIVTDFYTVTNLSRLNEKNLYNLLYNMVIEKDAHDHKMK
jgi:hypothetical protein